MARDKTEDRTDLKKGAVMKDINGRVVTESTELLRFEDKGGKLHGFLHRYRTIILTVPWLFVTV